MRFCGFCMAHKWRFTPLKARDDPDRRRCLGSYSCRFSDQCASDWMTEDALQHGGSIPGHAHGGERKPDQEQGRKSQEQVLQSRCLLSLSQRVHGFLHSSVRVHFLWSFFPEHGRVTVLLPTVPLFCFAKIHEHAVGLTPGNPVWFGPFLAQAGLVAPSKLADRVAFWHPAVFALVRLNPRDAVGFFGVGSAGFYHVARGPAGFVRAQCQKPIWKSALHPACDVAVVCLCFEESLVRLGLWPVISDFCRPFWAWMVWGRQRRAAGTGGPLPWAILFRPDGATARVSAVKDRRPCAT